MRESRKFTDVIFKSQEDNDLPPASRAEFYAHRSFLSAFGGYFHDMFTGDFEEARPASVADPVRTPLPHSKLAIKTVLGLSSSVSGCSVVVDRSVPLDYLYQGHLIPPAQQGIKIDELLEALELSRYLDLKTLLHNVQREIIKRRLLDPLNLERSTSARSHMVTR
jgi:BTB/POZ domain